LLFFSGFFKGSLTQNGKIQLKKIRYFFLTFFYYMFSSTAKQNILFNKHLITIKLTNANLLFQRFFY